MDVIEYLGWAATGPTTNDSQNHAGRWFHKSSGSALP
jgi:hypothetical protein